MAGYSGKTLIQKLGIKPGYRVAQVNAPSNYSALLGGWPVGVQLVELPEGELDFIHWFTDSGLELESEFDRIKQALKPAGMLWVSWPKAASKLPTDLNENVLRNTGLRHGLVDVKVCAVDETWSGLKFVYRLKDRRG